jgi:3-mercaptopropionate dioxygenase
MAQSAAATIERTDLPRVVGSCPQPLVAALRAALAAHGSWQQTADRVAAAIRASLPSPTDLLPAKLLTGDPAGYQTHLLHAEPDGSFSVNAMVWLPGQETPVHDHLAWCVTSVLQGDEYEEVYALRGDHLEVLLRSQNPPGTVVGYAPPGDIHKVCNRGDQVAVSMHVYGTDITRVGSSIRRIYDLPVR